MRQKRQSARIASGASVASAVGVRLRNAHRKTAEEGTLAVIEGLPCSGVPAPLSRARSPRSSPLLCPCCRREASALVFTACLTSAIAVANKAAAEIEKKPDGDD